MSEPRIRMATPEDAARVAAVYAPYVTGSVISFEASPPDEAEMRTRLEKTLVQHPWLVAEDGGAVVGYAYAGEHSGREAYLWSTTVSVYLADGARGRGLGRRLYAALFDVLRAQGYVRAYAGVALPNEASARLHRAAGFRPVGVYEGVGFKFGRWIDVEWLQLTLAEPAPDPAPPLPWHTLDPLPLP